VTLKKHQQRKKLQLKKLQQKKKRNSMKKPTRCFVPHGLVIEKWEDILPYFEEIDRRVIEGKDDLKRWLKESSELEAVMEEELAWRYIKMTIDTTSKDNQERYQFFVAEISPKAQPYYNKFNQKLFNSEYKTKLDDEFGYDVLLRSVEKELALFREENIPIQSELDQLSQEYGNIAGAMHIELDGKELTMQQAAKLLAENDSELRRAVYEKINERRSQDREAFHKLLDELIAKRQQVAKNADFENYRDYKFEAMGRFDYTAQDCFNFHDAVKQAVLPVMETIHAERKKQLQLTVLKPYDLEVDPTGLAPLKPFKDGKELIDKSIEAFAKINPTFGEYLTIMRDNGFLDLESKKGKAPGGYNYPLYESGVPFIFMNAVGTHDDLITMMHEGGHAIHSFLTADLKLTAFKSLPSEVAELASMSMELISMDVWDLFYTNEQDLKRAKKDQMERMLMVLPWVAIVDKFQHWLYENPTHSHQEREDQWIEMQADFGSSIVDWSGYENFKAIAWQKQLHIYEVPFYYIEYGFAQLGAIAVWKNYKENPKKALAKYQEALSLGYTKTIPAIYEAAGIQFNFSAAYVNELVDFVKSEMEAL
jgi:oligoendopeptidase F